jgi:hypothetical protein
MVTLAYLTTRAPSTLADDLMRAGYKVFEAISVSEVLYLIEHEGVDAVVIEHGVEDVELNSLRGTRITLQLTAKSTTGGILWELSNLFQKPSPAVH